MVQGRDEKTKTYRVGTGGLGTTGLSGDDNLINRKNRPGSLGGELDGPLLGYEEIEDTLLHGIKGAGVVVVLYTCQSMLQGQGKRKHTSISTPVDQVSFF